MTEVKTFEALDKFDDPCSVCPLRNEYCSPQDFLRGYDPPCSFAEGNIDDFIQECEESYKRWEEWEDRQIREKERKQEIVNKRKETTLQMHCYCAVELRELRQAKRNYKRASKSATKFEMYANAINFANEMMRNDERVKVNPIVSNTLEALKNKLDVAQKAYNEKRKEFYASRKAKIKEKEQEL